MQENRILLEKMERYTAYTGSANFRPWTARATLNFKAGMVYNGGGLHVDNMNVPVNPGTVMGGKSKTPYKKRKVCSNRQPRAGGHCFAALSEGSDLIVRHRK